jgi:hypothetical protein
MGEFSQNLPGRASRVIDSIGPALKLHAPTGGLHLIDFRPHISRRRPIEIPGDLSIEMIAALTYAGAPAPGTRVGRARVLAMIHQKERS